jgi:hypothetical protein
MLYESTACALKLLLYGEFVDFMKVWVDLSCMYGVDNCSVMNQPLSNLT